MTEEKSNIENQVNDTEAMDTIKEEEDQAAATAVKEEEEVDSKSELKMEDDDKDKSPSPEPPKDDKANSSGTPSKSKIKKEAAESKVKEEEESEDEEESEEEQKLGLFDQPLEVSGSRERKKVQRLDVSFSSATEKQQPEIPEGKGEKLGECPRIEHQIQKTHADELKPLHKILYKRLGSGMEIKKNIKKFCGFPFEKDSPDYQKKKVLLEKMTSPVLKHMCEVLDIERGGNKEEIVARLLDFLLKPEASGKAVPKPKKRGAKGGGEKRGPRSKKSVNSSATTEASDNDEEEKDNDDEDSKAAEQKNGSNESEGGEGNESEEKSEEDEPPKKKKKATPRKKATEKKAPVKRKSTTQRKPRNSKKAKLEVESGEEEDEEDKESDDEVLKKPKKPPTNDEIVDLVKKILEGANLEEITMKKVIKEVFEKFPDHDLAEKKEFIKSTVRSLIS